MADNDPFGRAKGEDPLADMGWTSSGATDASAGPADVVAPEQPDAAAQRVAQAERVALKSRGGLAPPGPRRMPGIPGARRRGNAGCVGAAAVLLFIAAVFAVVGTAAIQGIDEFDDPIPTVVTPPEREPARPSDRERPARPPRGLERASLLRRGNLAPALRRLRRVTRSSRVRLLRIGAQEVLVTTLLRGDRIRLAKATWDGEARVISTSPGGAGATSFAWTQIDASAPSRIVRAATIGRSSRSINYLVLFDSSGLGWSAYLKGGAIYNASPDGSAVTPVGG